MTPQYEPIERPEDMPRADALWTELANIRADALEEAIACCALTFPYLLPEDTATYMSANNMGFRSLPSPRSGFNPYCVSNLASKVTGFLFPSFGSTNFAIDLDPRTRIQGEYQGKKVNVLYESLDPEARNGIEEWLRSLTRITLSELSSRNVIQAAEECERNAITTGQLIYHMPRRQRGLMGTGLARSMRMDQIVADVDPYGNLITLVARESIHYRALPESVRAVIRAKRPTEKESKLLSMVFDLYTVLQRQIDFDEQVETAWYREWQECDGEVINKPNEYKNGKHPRWIFLPWRRAPGQVWGTGQVRSFYGLHTAHEGISQALQIRVAISAAVKKLVKPGSGININEYVKAGPGAVLQGDPDGIGEGRPGQPVDISLAQNYLEMLTRMLEMAYGIVNFEPVERRTTVEAKQIMLEVNSSNAGLLSLHAEGFLKPVIQMVLDELLEDEAVFPQPIRGLRESLRPTVIAGIEAVNRANQKEGWAQFLGIVKGAEDAQLTKYSDRAALYRKAAADSALDLTKILYNAKQIAEVDNNEQLQQAVAAVMEQLAKNPDALGQLQSTANGALR